MIKRGLGNRTFAFVLFIASTMTPALAQEPAAREPATPEPATQEQGMELSSADRKFVEQAAAGGMMEITTGRLAAERGTSQEVKAYGQRMVEEHSRANGELLQLAAKKGATMSDNDRAKHARDMAKARDKLSKYSGEEFDRMYMKMQVQDHEKMVALLERAAESGADADLKAWAAKMLPAVREHLEMARTHSQAATAEKTTDM